MHPEFNLQRGRWQDGQVYALERRCITCSYVQGHMGKHQVDWEAEELRWEQSPQSLWVVSQEGMGETGQVKILIKISEPRAKEVISSCLVPGSGGILAWCIRVREKKWLGLGLGVGWLGYERHANRWTVCSSGNELTWEGQTISPHQHHYRKWKTGLIYTTCSLQDGFLSSWPFHTLLSLCNFHLLDLWRFQLTLRSWHKLLLDKHTPSVICSGGTHHLVLQEPWLTARGILENSPGASSICIPEPCLLQRTRDIEQVTNLPQSDVFICKMRKTATLKGLWGKSKSDTDRVLCAGTEQAF